MSSIDVRPGHRGSVKELAGTLGRAFYDDPVMMWLLPDSASRAKGLPRMFSAMARHHFLRGGGVQVAARRAIGAVALWDAPGCWKHSRLQEALMIPSFIRVFGSRIGIGQELSEMMKREHPEEPHWYLAMIGSDPSVRGQGFGKALMQAGLDRADADHAPAYLESTKPDNIPYYQRFGFEVTGELTVPGGGPPMWPMWRPAR